MTATELISRRVVSFVTPGIFATARSAKNACRNPLDCGDAFFADLAAADAAFVKASNNRFTALESFVVVVEQDEFATGIQATVGNSGAHRAGTDDGD